MRLAVSIGILVRLPGRCSIKTPALSNLFHCKLSWPATPNMTAIWLSTSRSVWHANFFAEYLLVTLHLILLLKVVLGNSPPLWCCYGETPKAGGSPWFQSFLRRFMSHLSVCVCVCVFIHCSHPKTVILTFFPPDFPAPPNVAEMYVSRVLLTCLLLLDCGMDV